mgnify:FL=1
MVIPLHVVMFKCFPVGQHWLWPITTLALVKVLFDLLLKNQDQSIDYFSQSHKGQTEQ